MSEDKKKCAARIPGNILTSYPCWNYARAGSNYCYWHDPEKGPERIERARKQAEDRRLEREAIPVCPKCGEARTLKLADNMKIRCFKVYGGCGAMFTLDEFPTLYREDTGTPAKSSTPKKRGKR